MIERMLPIIGNNQWWWSDAVKHMNDPVSREITTQYEFLYGARLSWKKVTPYMLDRVLREEGHTTDFVRPVIVMTERVYGIFGTYVRLLQSRFYDGNNIKVATVHGKRLMKLSLHMETEYHEHPRK